VFRMTINLFSDGDMGATSSTFHALMAASVI
jgi:hypothetical protein